jgi:DNA-binding SARP family transcriptional activator
VPTGHLRGATAAELGLLGGFALRLDDQPISVPLSCQRLLVFLAFHDQPLQRSYIAGTLWPDYREMRSIANLRTTLARLPHASRRLVQIEGRQLSLSDWVSVDVRQTTELMRSIVDHDHRVIGVKGIHRRLMLDILPDWYEDWIVTVRERYRELRLHALETLCDALTEASDFATAIEAGLCAVEAEPLRESARRALIRAYLAEGNQAAAVLQYRRFSTLLNEELGLAPSPSLTTLMPPAEGEPRQLSVR